MGAAHRQQYSLIPIHKKTKRERGFILHYSAPSFYQPSFLFDWRKGRQKKQKKMADTKAKAKADYGAELTAKELKEKKLLEKENGKGAATNGKENEENGEPELDEDDEEEVDEEDEEDEGEGDEEDDDDDDDVEGGTKRGADDDDDDDDDDEDDVKTKKQKTDDDD